MSLEPVLDIVHENPEVRNSLTLLLEVEGLKFEVSNSAEEFLTSFDRNPQGCLVADLQMPGMDGYQLHCHLIKDRIRYSSHHFQCTHQ